MGQEKGTGASPMNFENYPIYIIHYTPLKERKIFLNEQLKREALYEKTHWIENFDRETITEWPELELSSNELSKGVIAVNMAHSYALEKIAESSEGYGLILEDDVVLKKNSKALIQKYCNAIPDNWDMISIGSACGFHIPFWRRRPGKHVYLKENTKTRWGGDGATRCADSYFVSSKGAKLLLSSRAMQRPFLKPIDWALNEAIRDKNLNVYWMEPTVAHQGSQSGHFEGGSYRLG